jgi:CheY-like chemotaxis protein/two-component sensor histidine kinase
LFNNKKGNLDDSEVEDARVIYESGYGLLSLINDIMDLSKVEAGMLAIYPERIRLDDITRNLRQIFDPIAVENKLIFQITIDHDMPTTIISDGLRLEQILRNLLANAMKFTERGSVMLKIARPSSKVEFSRETLTTEAAVAFRVIDTGVGISADKKQTIFEAFQQEDGSTSRKFGGTGLGLTIARELAQLLGGEITMESVQQVGSMFTLYLPLEFGSVTDGARPESRPTESVADRPTVSTDGSALPRHSRTTPADKPNVQLIREDHTHRDPEGKVLLIIDDDGKLTEILKEFARDHGFKSLVADNGRTGIYLAQVHQPDGIVLDLGLPDIHGYKVLEQIKSNPETRRIPVQIISACSDDKDTPLSKETVGFFTKPVLPEQLNNVLKDIIDDNERFEPELYSSAVMMKGGDSREGLLGDVSRFLHKIESMPEREKKQSSHSIRDENPLLKNRKILLVDENMRTAYALSKQLINTGLDVEMVANGREAVELLKEDRRYELVLMDLRMPVTDGKKAVKQIRRTTGYEHIPIIALTAKSTPQDREKCLTAGVSEYLTKPVDFETLLSIVQTRLSNTHEELERERASG